MSKIQADVLCAPVLLAGQASCFRETQGSDYGPCQIVWGDGSSRRRVNGEWACTASGLHRGQLTKIRTLGRGPTRKLTRRC
jgi:hypothetical protein